ELVLALAGALVHGLPVAGLSPGLELLGEAWANRTGTVRDGWCGAGRVRRRSHQGKRRRVRAPGGRKRSGHAVCCPPGPSAGQRGAPLYRSLTGGVSPSPPGPFGKERFAPPAIIGSRHTFRGAMASREAS